MDSRVAVDLSGLGGIGRLLLGLAPLLLSAVAQETSPLIKERRVSCNSNSMDVDFEFNGPFNGVIYPDKHWKDECKWFGNSARQKVITIPLNTDVVSGRYCGVSLDESRGEFRVLLKISPVSNLLVEGMAALEVRCRYNINDVTLTLPVGANGAGLFISPQTQAGVVTGSGGAPFLQMAIREGHGITGGVLSAATVGQRITLDVVMQDTTIYDFYVRDCFAHDGTKQSDASISIVDLDGCAVSLARAVDAPVFVRPPSPSTEDRSKHVYVHMYGFQFTTSQLVYFECQVKPCLGDCNRPGNCFTNTRLRRSARYSRQSPDNQVLGIPNLAGNGTEGADYSLKTVIRIRPQELLSVVPAAQLGDAGMAENTLRVAGVDPSGKRLDDEVCIAWGVAVAILAIFILVCLVSLAIAAYVCCRAGSEGRKLYTPASSAASSVLRGPPAFASQPRPANPHRIRH